MAVVPDKMIVLSRQIELMTNNRHFVSDVISSISTQQENETSIKSEPILSMGQNQTDNEINVDSVKKEMSSEPAESQTRANRQLRRNANQLNQSVLKEESSHEPMQFEFVFIFHAEDLEISHGVITEDKDINKLINLKTKLAQPNDLIDMMKEYKLESVKLMGAKADEPEKTPSLGSEKVSIKKVIDLSQIKLIDARLQQEIDSNESKYNDEIERRNKYKVLKSFSSFFFV